MGAFASLNASYAAGDAKEAVDENLRRLQAAAKSRELLTISQVHGTVLVEDGSGAEADAIFTAKPGRAVGVRTADCLPILVEDQSGHRVAAVHAGWRGVIGEITPLVIGRFLELGAPRSSLKVALGPAIQRCCFEVDGDLPQRFSDAFGSQVVVGGYDKPHLDLSLAVRVSLERLGLADAQIDTLPHCTMCDQRFFSHRRSRGVTGRQLSFITCRFETDL